MSRRCTSAPHEDSDSLPHSLTHSLRRSVAYSPYSPHLTHLTSYHRQGERIFTIDPITARDLDDAISVRKLDDDIVEVSVHIADVSHFVPKGSCIDKEASDRCTTVYLPRLCYPMLPRPLCDDLCSLHPHSDKFAITLTFCASRTDGRVSDQPTRQPKYFLSVIQSCCRFSYGQVQTILERKDTRSTWPVVSHPHTTEQIRNDLHLLYQLTQAMKKRRYEEGGVALTKSKMVVMFDRKVVDSNRDGVAGGVTGIRSVHGSGNESEVEEGVEDGEEVEREDEDPSYPIGFSIDSGDASHSLIEELMLKANYIVGGILHTKLPEIAVLRSHGAPDRIQLDRLSELLTRLGVEHDFSSAKGLHNTLISVSKKSYGPSVREAVEFLLRVPMVLAEYFSGDDRHPSHYALNFDVYTHFTSPIRRYPDLMVHRQLRSLLSEQTEEALVLPTEREALREQCTLCNSRKIAARAAHDYCLEQMFIIHLLSRETLYTSIATVIRVDDRSLKVELTLLDLSHRLNYDYCEKVLAAQTPQRFRNLTHLPVKGKSTSSLGGYFEWRRSVEDTVRCRQAEARGEAQDQPGKIIQRFKLFSHIPVWIIPLEVSPLKFQSLPIPPWHDDYVSLVAASAEGGDAGRPLPSQADEFASLGGIGECDSMTRVEAPADDEAVKSSGAVLDVEASKRIITRLAH